MQERIEMNETCEKKNENKKKNVMKKMKKGSC